jgi:spermidine synthase
MPAFRQFPQDMDRVSAEVNRLSNQVLVTTYEAEWGRVGR